MSLLKISSIVGRSARFLKKEAAFPQRNISTTRKAQQNVKHYIPNNLEKRFLVWSGKYKRVEDIPSHISYEEMERCRNKVRIRLANIMIGLTIVGCCVMIYDGKQSAKRGETVSKQNLDWHKKYNELSAQNTIAKDN